MTRTSSVIAALVLVAAFGAQSAQAAKPPTGPPKTRTLAHGWEVRSESAAPAEPQAPPPEEDGPDDAARVTVHARASQAGPWRPTAVPSVFDPLATPSLYPGAVKRYRLRFRAPKTLKGFRWMLQFEEVRRYAGVFLNGHRIGRSRDPYVPFQMEAKGLKPGKRNTLTVLVDSRKDPRLAEGWWNWGGIVRPVRLTPLGKVDLGRPNTGTLGVMPKVRCSGPARGCKAQVTIDAVVQRRMARRIKPVVSVRLRSPGGRITTKKFKLPRQRAKRRRVKLTVKVKRPVLWSPDRPALYLAQITVRNGNAVQQVQRMRIGLRSVQVKQGLLFLNNRRIQLRGASIHEDMPGHGAAMSRFDNSTTVRNLKELGANVVRAHYLLNEDLLKRLDKAGIMVWNEAPIWQRDCCRRQPPTNLLRRRGDILRALSTVKHTVMVGRNHPSVVTHSVANELAFAPDQHPGTKRFLKAAAVLTRKIDPYTPVSVDTKARLNLPQQRTYLRYFDMLGLNQYFGWYGHTSNVEDLSTYLLQMRRNYPRLALVNTEFGAEARPSEASGPANEKGTYAFQTNFVGRTLEIDDSQTYLSGAIHWTLREFEIYPGWKGGAPAPPKNTRHNKGLLTYGGQRKPAWYVARDHFKRTPLYP